MTQENTIKSAALNTIEIESQAISNLKDQINDLFCEAIKKIFSSSGRLVITGIGKSAIIAQKIVATMNSTGTPSVFMHAADAIHGDLGMIRSEDIVLCISKSGETPEIKALIPLAKHLGNALIGMASNPESYLAKNADYYIRTPITEEADPNNLAPTASTSVQMAMGDAMAMALLSLRGFTPKDFAQFHPGGALGKQLYLKVIDLSSNNESPKVLATDSVRKTIMEITSKRLGATAVLDENNVVIGIITDGDLRRMMEQHSDTKDLIAKEIMSPSPKTIQSDELAVKALSLMRSNSISQLIVMQDEQYGGILHLHDLIREGII